MRAEHTTTTRYHAVNGAVFSSEEDCLRYEATLPRAMVYRLENAPPASPDRAQLFEFGYHFTTSRNEYDEGGFLREQGWSVVTDDHSHVLGLVFGTYHDVVAYVVQHDDFWERRSWAFIRPKSLVVLTPAVLQPQVEQP